MKDISWKHVVVIVAFLGTLGVLTVTGNETGTFVAIGVAVLGALGLMVQQGAQTREQTTAVKEQTNGNQSRMMDIIEAQGKLLAAMQPPQPLDTAEWTPPKDEP